MIKNADLLHENGDQIFIAENEKDPDINIVIRLHDINDTIFNTAEIHLTSSRLSFDQLLKKSQEYGFKIIRMYMNSKENDQ